MSSLLVLSTYLPVLLLSSLLFSFTPLCVLLLPLHSQETQAGTLDDIFETVKAEVGS